MDRPPQQQLKMLAGCIIVKRSNENINEKHFKIFKGSFNTNGLCLLTDINRASPPTLALEI